MTEAEARALPIGSAIADNGPGLGTIVEKRLDCFSIKWTTPSTRVEGVSTFLYEDAKLLQPSGPATGFIEVRRDDGIPAVGKKGTLTAIHFAEGTFEQTNVTAATTWNSTNTDAATVGPGSQINYVGSPGPVDFQGNYRGLTSTTSIAFVWPPPSKTTVVDGQTFEIYETASPGGEWPIAITGNSSGTKRGKITIGTSEPGTVVATFDLGTVTQTIDNMIAKLTEATGFQWGLQNRGTWMVMIPSAVLITSITIAEAPADTSLNFFGNTIPPVEDANDGLPYTLGLVFKSSVAGAVVGVRFYKSVANGGAHVGNLWQSNGNMIGQVNFGGETASGWQEQLFGAPIPIPVNTLHIISVNMPEGHYAGQLNYFTTDIVSGPLTAPLSGTVPPGNGRFIELVGNPNNPVFPNQSVSSANYWVDVMFQPS